MAVEFIHLHLHSQYSLLSSTVRLEALFERLKELSMPAAALTDSGNLFGAVSFYQGMLKNGLKPILGCELKVTCGSRFDRPAQETLHTLVVLAQDEEGYRNLLELTTAGYLQGFHNGVPRVDKELLARFSKGLTALSGDRTGEIAVLLLKEEEPLALQAAGQYGDIFGKNNFFIEIFDHGREDEKKLVPRLAELSRKTGFPLVAANNVHYLKPQDAAAQEILRCLAAGEVFDEKRPYVLGPPEYDLKSAAEMKRRFSDYPQSLQNTVEIAERAHVDLKFGETLLPKFPIPKGFATEDDYLWDICRKRLKERFSGKVPQEAQERLQKELSVIAKTGFAGYFLMVWDMIRKAEEKNIPVGPGRGSAAGSFVAYVLGITQVNPLEFGLLFERFINPERISAPDIDVDVCDRRREEVLEEMVAFWGRDRVAAIVTFGTLAARAAVRDVGRVLGWKPADIDRLAKRIPWEYKDSLESALANVPELKALAKEGGETQKLLDTAKLLEGLPRHVSTHAAGVVVADRPLVERVPLCLGPGGEILTQYDMDALKEIGFVKLDVLGLRTLTVLDDTVQWVKRLTGKEVCLDRLPLDDAKTYRLLREGRTLGVFQLESRGMRDYLRKLAPHHLTDLIALLALYRPGPLGSEMADDFIRRKKGLTPVRYLHPYLEPILKETYGVILYQEQVMQIAEKMAGFTLGQADLLRRAMSRKDPDEMEAQRAKFLKGAEARGVAREVSEKVFDLIAKFAGYGFNKSHSTAYALVAYQAAYLKAHYPAEFMASQLSSEIGRQDKIAQYIQEAAQMGVKIHPPDVNESALLFEPDQDGGIRFGLLAVKNVGEAAVKALLKAREKGPFLSLWDFCRRVDLSVWNPKMLESLIRAGAFDKTGAKRAALLACVEQAFQRGQEHRRNAMVGQASLFAGWQEEEGYPDLPELHPSELLSGEKEVLGFYLSGHPLARFEDELEHYAVPTSELENLPDGAPARLAGQILGVSRGKTKKGNEIYARFLLEDLHGHCDILVWPDAYAKVGALLEKDRLVAVFGRVDKEADRRQVIALEVIPLEETAERWAKAVCFRLWAAGGDPKTVEKLRALCERHPGEVKVTFELESLKHGWIHLETDRIKVKPTGSFLKAAEKLLGEGNVEVVL